MSIWQRKITVKDLNDLNRNTLGEFFEINFTEVGDNYLKATMPVNSKTKQPFGLLHGGASVALAETIGSVASWCAINKDLFMGVGVEINASHIKAVTEGVVTAHCAAIKVSGKTHVWEIKIYNQQNELCCVSRFTAMVVPLKK
jgi:1,4-dihydroxy-2-naphthoyl-CoA hydrolase